MKHLTTRQWAVYKGMGGKYGAIQFDLQYPYWYNQSGRDYTGEEALERDKEGKLSRRLKDGWKSREGCVFLQITSPKDKNVYDWEQKIVIALSVTDMGTLLETLVTGKECNIVHDPHAKSAKQGDIKKFLSAKKSEQGVLISATQTAGGEKRSHTVPLSVSESLTLRELLQKAIPASLAW